MVLFFNELLLMQTLILQIDLDCILVLGNHERKWCEVQSSIILAFVELCTLQNIHFCAILLSAGNDWVSFLQIQQVAQ